MRAMILAAGLGTRLRPLTFERPKPLVPIGDRPAIAHIAKQLWISGISEFIINTHHRAEAFEGPLVRDVPGRMIVSHEAEILGTAGGITRAAPWLGDGDVLVWNGDILTPLDVAALRDHHARSADLATLVVSIRPRGEGTVGLDAAGRVVRLRGERFGDEALGGDYLGIALLSFDFRRTLPAPGCLVGDGFLPWLRAGRALGTFVWDAGWDDIGDVRAYLAANARWLARSNLPYFVGETAIVSPGVDVAGAVVGAGARVFGDGSLAGAVVWPGSTVTRPEPRAVHTTEGRVVGVAP